MPKKNTPPIDLTTVAILRTVNERLEGVTLQGLIVRSQARLSPASLALAQLDTGLFAARAKLAAEQAEVEQVRTRARLVAEYMAGDRAPAGWSRARPMSASAAEEAARRDDEYLSAKERAAELAFYADAARAVQHCLDVQTALGGQDVAQQHLAAIAGGAN